MAKVTVLTYVGEEWAAGRLTGDEPTEGKYIGWGSGNGTAIKAGEELFFEESEDRAVGIVSLVGTGIDALYQVEGTLTADGTKTITEAATFTASTSGRMIIHCTLDTGIPLDLDDQITFTFTIDPQ